MEDSHDLGNSLQKKKQRPPILQTVTIKQTIVKNNPRTGDPEEQSWR